jgi:hypothetical protein
MKERSDSMMKVLPKREAPAAGRAGRRDRWIRLKDHWTLNSFRFLVEVRSPDERLRLPLAEAEVRVRGPLCPECGEPTTRVETAPNYERYACRHGERHCEYWVGRVNHQGFSEFVAEHVRPEVFRAILEGRLGLEPMPPRSADRPMTAQN